MNKFKVLFKYELVTLALSRWFLVYLGGFNIILFTLRYFSNSNEQLFVSIFNVILYYHFITLLLFSILAWQNNSKFTFFIMTQPVSRANVFLSRFGSFCLGVTIATALSLLGQLFFYFDSVEIFRLLAAQLVLEIIFIGLGFFLAIKIQEHLKAIAVAMGLILFFALLLDGLNIWIIINYSRYPLERILFFLCALNPLTLVKFQAMALETTSLWTGYAGLVLQRAWSSGLIQGVTLTVLSLWIVVPIALAWKTFARKDF